MNAAVKWVQQTRLEGLGRTLLTQPRGARLPRRRQRAAPHRPLATECAPARVPQPRWRGRRRGLVLQTGHVSGAEPVPRGRGGAGRRSRPSGRSGLRALAGRGPASCCCAPPLLGPDRIRSGAMSVDKTELCGSLLTWVGRGAGPGQVCVLSSRPLLVFPPLSWGWKEG